MDNDPLESGLSDLMGALLNSFDSDTAEKAGKYEGEGWYKKASELASKGDHENFYFSFSRHLSELVDGILINADIPIKARFFIKHAQFAGRHLVKVIEQYEGGACSHDKEQFLLTAIIKHYMHGETYRLDFDREYTFHLPKVVFQDEKELITFADAVQSVYYGDMHSYLSFMQTYMQTYATRSNEYLESLRNEANNSR